MTAEIAFSPLLPWPVIAVLAAIGVALILWQAIRRGRGAFIRLLAFGVIVLALLNPRAVEELRRTEPDVALVVVDRTTSQKVGDRPARTEQALQAIERSLGAFEHLDVRRVEVTDAGLSADAPEGEQGTRIAAALSRALADVPQGRFAGALVVSDGQVHDAGQLDAGKLPGPLHVLLTGDKGERDRRLVVEQAPRFGIVGKQTRIVYRLEDKVSEAAEGFAANRAEVTVSVDGKPVETAQVPAGRDVVFEMEIKHAGPNVIEIAAAPAEGELSPVNNRAVVTVNGVRDRLRVLLVSGQPHAGERMWRNLLKSDPSVDLVHFTILRPPEKDDFTPLDELSLIAFPTQELFQEKIDDFDMIVFDRYVIRDVLPPSYLRNIGDYVQKGGALMMAVGPEFAGLRSMYRTPLGRSMPVAPTGNVAELPYHPRTTDVGRRHPVTRDLPGAAQRGTQGTPAWGRWFRHVDGQAERGDQLMTGAGDRPLLVLERIEEGRVAQLMSDHIWLWARGFEGGGPQAELLRRLAHWLMKEPELEEESLTARVEDGELIVERRSLEPGTEQATVTAPSGQESNVTLEVGEDGLGSARLDVSETGLYRIDAEGRTAFAAVGALNPIELADLRSTEVPLSPAVDATGGAQVWFGEAGMPEVRRTRPGRDTAGRDWLGLIENRAYTVTGVREVPLMPGLLAMLLAVGLLAFAWWREGR